MNSSKEQIQGLYNFTREKRVRYVDVQLEIVDHLAAVIEEFMEKDPTLEFEKALQKVYNQYPITGFLISFLFYSSMLRVIIHACTFVFPKMLNDDLDKIYQHLQSV